MTATKGGFLNYSTVVDPVKSANECTTLLVAHGAMAIGTTFDRKFPTGLTFVMETPFGPRKFSLPVNIDGTHKALLKAWRDGKIRQAFTTEDQARRVAWRVLKDWLELQIALVESGVAEFSQVMLPYVHVDGEDRTLWDRYLDNERKALER